jgi:hypothetical protein
MPFVSRRANFARVLCSLLPIAVLFGTQPAQAVPSFARQTGMACEACHTSWPELTHFGRVFKANGYALDNLKQVRDVGVQREEILSLASLPPVSIMVEASYSQTAKAQPDSAGNGTSQNGTVAFPQQASLFYAGKIAPHVGAFIQLTYANDSGSFAIDNTDLRFADLKVLPGDQTLIYGLSLNNNPTVQDLYNSTPAFGFPYAASGSAPGVPYGTQIDGARAQDVAGLTAYAFWNESLYAELGLYRSAKQGTAGPLDSTSAGGVLASSAPYWRLAYEHNWGRNSLEAGIYGASFKIYPDLGIPGSPGFQHHLGGPSDRYQDVAEDLQYQYIAEHHLVSVTATRIHETQTLAASVAHELAGSVNNDLTTTRAFATYYYKHRVGATAGFFRTTGTTDEVLTPNGPDTQGWIAEVNYMPWLNTKISLQYTAFSRFAGLSRNYDGAGRNASDNNTLYALIWVAF